MERKLDDNRGISENTNACLDMATGDYIGLFDHDDLLHPSALYEYMQAICGQDADFLYSDENTFHETPADAYWPHYKPDYSPDTLRSYNYICHFTVFSRELLARAGGFRSEFDGSQDHDMILRLTHRARGIAHISKVLYLWRSLPTSVASDINSKTYAINAGRSAVEAFLREEKGINAEVESTEVFPTMYRIRYPMEGKPRVRVILDARLKRGLDAVILRAGNLMGRSTDGEFQINFETNSFIRSLWAYINLGECPVTILENTEEFSPIDSVASAVLKLAGADSRFSIFHVYNNHTVTMADILAAIRSHGFDVKTVSEEHFRQTLAETAKHEEESRTVISLMAYANRVQEDLKEVKGEQRFTTNALFRLNFKWPIIDDAYLERLFWSLDTLGFFSLL